MWVAFITSVLSFGLVLTGYSCPNCSKNSTVSPQGSKQCFHRISHSKREMALSHFHMHTHSSQFISTAAAKVSHMHQFLYCCLLLTSSEQTAIYRHNLVLKTYKKPSLNTPYYRIINITFCIKVKKKKKKKQIRVLFLPLFSYICSLRHTLCNRVQPRVAFCHRPSLTQCVCFLMCPNLRKTDCGCITAWPLCLEQFLYNDMS